jgi:hypothetical protein
MILSLENKDGKSLIFLEHARLESGSGSEMKAKAGSGSEKKKKFGFTTRNSSLCLD